MTTPSNGAARPLVPGFLLEPFGWAGEPLSLMAAAEPAILPHLFALDRPRMHLIALCLAHTSGDLSPEFARVLVRGSLRTILLRVLGRSPDGVWGICRKLPE